MEELPGQWKESIIVPIYMKGDKTDCTNMKACDFSATYTVLSSVVL